MITHASPGSKPPNGERATSTSFANTHRWPARRRASSPRLRYSPGYSTSCSTNRSRKGQRATLSEPRMRPQAGIGGCLRGWHTPARGPSFRPGETPMRVSRHACWLFTAGVLFCAAASAAELPISDFIKHPTLRNPVISPDGKYLAVVYDENTDSTDASYQLAVLQLPDLKPVSRLDMAPRFMPFNVHWVSDTRLVMGLAKETGTLVEPSTTGDIVAVDFDGSAKKTLYSSSNHRGGLFSNANSLDIPRGFPSIAGKPLQPNGHFFLNLNRVRVGGTTANLWQYGQSDLYDVDSSTGHAVPIGGIDHGGMKLLPYGDIARIAAGENTQMQAVAFYSIDGRTWKPMPDSVVGKSFDPLGISADGKHLYALSSLDGGPDQLIECDLDGGNRKVLASDSFSSVTDVMWNRSE